MLVYGYFCSKNSPPSTRYNIQSNRLKKKDFSGYSRFKPIMVIMFCSLLPAKTGSDKSNRIAEVNTLRDKYSNNKLNSSKESGKLGNHYASELVQVDNYCNAILSIC